jgi:hypothetical protein
MNREIQILRKNLCDNILQRAFFHDCILRRKTWTLFSRDGPTHNALLQRHGVENTLFIHQLNPGYLIA